WQKRGFKNSFAAVDETRSTDRPVLDQFDVPGQGYGLNGLLRLPLGAKTSLEAGFDARFMSGATNELFRNLGAGFTRQRNAGGRERLAGLHAQIVHEPMDALSLSASVRLDAWKTKNGRRLETDLADGSVVREDDIPSRKGTVFNGRFGAHYELSETWALRAAAYTGFRLPTINEFYRPFRVRNDITEANPALSPERLYGIDLGLERSLGGAGSFRATIFRNWLRDGVGNVTIALGPGFFPPTGFVPDGGTLRQRQNIDRIAADGLEAELDVELSRRVSLSAGYLFSRVRVRRFQLGPELEGRRLAQSPKHQAVFSLAVTPAERLRLEASARWTAKAFDDDLNSRVLADALTLDAGAEFELASGVILFGAVENLFDARVESARSADGLVTIVGPRRLSAGFRLGF
ncbi:MAG: TonB-dependent receptor, partial [Sphingomonadales bacterium]